MSNKNRDTKPLEGETIEQAAIRHTELPDGEKTEYSTGKYNGFIKGANWQKEQSTERVDGITISDAKDLAAKRHGYADWYQIQCLEIEPWEKEEIRANLIDDVASFYGLLIEYKVRAQLAIPPSTSTKLFGVETLPTKGTTSTTIEALAEKFANDNWGGSQYVKVVFIAAYTLRDNTVKDLIEARIKELNGDDLKNWDIHDRIEELTNLLAQLKK